ncbi:hypothetical protein FQN54_005762 [Arachnomyces sp. PD_36]|nr:hypothetical protein FQN54_005762 [Arachnomyces sp. PD_36]
MSGQRDGEMEGDNELLTEISRSGDSIYIRGVKRLRTLDVLKGRSFLETKWEHEVSTRKSEDILRLGGEGVICADHGNDIGKCPARENLDVIDAFLESYEKTQESESLEAEPREDKEFTEGDVLRRISTPAEDDERLTNTIGLGAGQSLSILAETEDMTAENNIDSHTESVSTSPTAFSIDIMEEQSEEEETGDIDSEEDTPGIDRAESVSAAIDGQENIDSDVFDDRSEAVAAKANPADEGSIENLEVEHPALAVPTTLKLPTLAGDDAELFSEFLSRAKAKREANCAMTPNGSTNVVETEQITHSPTPRTRRALEQLDKNSPTPQKKKRSTKKSEPLPVSPAHRADAEESGCSEKAADKSENTATTCRRSNRTRTAKIPRPHAPPNVPHQIPVRRANGTEFIFLKRTEAQQISLSTRANTRRNRGDALMPKYKLQEMAKQQGEATEEGRGVEASDPTAPRDKPIGKKQVSWNEQQLVQYADGTDPEDIAPAEEPQGNPGKGQSNSSETKSQLPKRSSTPATKRVRRLGAPSSSSVISSTSGHTPMPKRTKLVPRSPKVDATLSSSTRSKKSLTGRKNGQFLPLKSGMKPSEVK